MNTSIEIKEYLISNDIKPSLQRIKIYEYLVNHKTHPRVDEIYSALVDEMPTLSRTTVYNTLKLFIDHGIIRSISIEDNEKRFDADIRDHGHFKCKICQKVYDFDVDLKHSNIGKDLEGFVIQEKDLYYKGICKDCNAKTK